MITVLSSPKHGSGTSTTAALLALAARHDLPTHLVDLCGDQVSILGLTRGINPTIQVDRTLAVSDLAHATTDQQTDLVHRLANLGAHVVVDAGDPTHPIHDRLPAGAVRRWILRPCYLSMRRATACPVRPDEVILLAEPGRALTARDVEAVIGAPVTATLDVHPQIARAVDAGLLTGRAPTNALTALERLAHSDKAATR